MKLLLIGESILCNYAFGDKNQTKASLNVDEVEIIRVQSMATYITAIDSIKDYDVVVVSSVLNQLSNLEHKWQNTIIDEEKSNQVNDTINDFVKVINDATIESPNTKIIVLPPTICTNPKWIFDSFEQFNAYYLDAFNNKIVKANKPPISEIDPQADGVHLKDLPLI